MRVFYFMYVVIIPEPFRNHKLVSFFLFISSSTVVQLFCAELSISTKSVENKTR